MNTLSYLLVKCALAWSSVLLPLHVESLAAGKGAAPTPPSIAGSATPTAADTAPVLAVQEVPGESGWGFEVTPYAWLFGVEGDGEVNGQSFEFERKFEDLVDQVDVAGSLLAMAHYGRFLVSLEYDHASISNDDLDVGGEFESDFDLLEFGVGYRLDGWADGQTFDLLVGARSLELDNELTINGVGTFQDDIELTDPMFFVRPRVPIFTSSVEGLVLNPTFGVGGGGDSDLVYELAPQLEYTFSDTIEGRFGYRRVAYEFEEGNDELDVSFAGLLFGIGFNF